MGQGQKQKQQLVGSGVLQYPGRRWDWVKNGQKCISEIWGYEGEEKDEIRVSHSNLKDGVTTDSMGTLRE